jgi:hypothetical protein
MEITLFFGLFFISITLACIYYTKAVVYLGVLAGIMIILLGTFLAATGYIERVDCFSERQDANLTASENYTSYTYATRCTTTTLPLDRNMINAMGILMMIIGAGMVADVVYVWRRVE